MHSRHRDVARRLSLCPVSEEQALIRGLANATEVAMLNRFYRGPAVLAVLAALSLAVVSFSQKEKAKPDPRPSWNDGPAKKAILEFVRATTDKASDKYVPPAERIATFDQDGTLWVEHPMYTQVVYCMDRVAVVVKE